MGRFQTEVRKAFGVANPGDLVEAQGSHVLVKQMITEDDNCKVGDFVRVGSKEGLCKSAANIGKVIGIIINDKYYNREQENLTLSKGTSVTVALFGVVAIKNTATSAATFMDDIYLKDSDGKIIFANASASGTTKTEWVIKQGCNEEGIAFVSR